jgi:isoquinoline 1-oxidoreductase subunit beta
MLPRRDFLKTSALSGVALALGFLPNGGQAAEAAITKLPLAGLQDFGSPFIALDAQGGIVLISPRPDMGQGTFQSLPMVLAEELEVTLDQVQVRWSDGAQKFGDQLSGGSSSVRLFWEPLRKAGAAAREMLVQAAANQWKVSPADCRAERGQVVNLKNKKTLTYAQLVAAAAQLPVPSAPKLKDPKDFTLVGKSLPKADVPPKSNGTAQFGLDVKVPGMLYASIERSPTIHGAVKTVDDRRAKAVPGVRHVLKCERSLYKTKFEGVAVVADNYWAAVQARKQLRVEWDTAQHRTNTDDLFAKMRETAASQPGNVQEEEGSFAKVWGQGHTQLEAVYETPFLAHAALEPMNCVVHVREGECEVWAPNQGPDYVRRDLAKYLNLPEDKIIVHIQFMGGSFGRKSTQDEIKEAAFLSRELKVPIKLIWTREDDMTQGPFRPGMVSKLQGVLDAQGQLLGLHHLVVGPSIQHQHVAPLAPGKPDGWAGEAISTHDSPYAVPNYRRSHHLVETEIPLLWWRSVYSSTNLFGHECFMDELAHAAKQDPLEFRLKLLKASPHATAARMAGVLELLREKARWGEKLPAGQAQGMAIGRCFETACAHVITVAKTAAGIQVVKVVSVIDCGIALNPDNVKAQTEGNVVMGLTAAVKDGITFQNGQAQQANYNRYRLLRINETPPIEVHLVPSAQAPTGVGEPGLPPVAPALANAIFALTGERPRKLPLGWA